MSDKVSTLLGDNAISAQEAAQKLADPSRAAFEKDGDLSKVEEELDGLWSAILTKAEQTPHDQQDDLVDLMRAIKNMPQPVHEGKKFVIWDEEQRWDQLPLFGAKARERLDIAQEKPGGGFVNLSAFFARLTASDVDDLSLFAIWVFREALEDPAEDEIAQKTPPKLLKAVTVWLIYATEILAKFSEEKKQFDGKIAKPGASLSALKDEPGWRGFCPDRWNAWKTRLASLKKTESLADAKSLIDQALDEASKIEKA
ncbi:hypothetical protein NM208_g8986 [Fusarium decemcellulare]|uniref:Uncharacterized protein n=1 Tax=Fusarium decemcellulare TaxID=57161 RepID=A0ACC1S3G7_9HYPO|nr:hypothetical protein NM208_g8986 [Fusarium decemcellulare]